MTKRQSDYLRALASTWFPSWRERCDHFHARSGVLVPVSEAKRLSELWGIACNQYTGHGSPAAPKMTAPVCGLCGGLGGVFGGERYECEGQLCPACVSDLECEIAERKGVVTR